MNADSISSLSAASLPPLPLMCSTPRSVSVSDVSVEASHPEPEVRDIPRQAAEVEKLREVFLFDITCFLTAY